MTGPVCAANGLVTIMDEDSVENFDKAGKYGNTLWARYTFQITTYHSSGQSIPTVRRSVEVIRSGAQAAGSAQSYVLKQYQRALYQIPTGDKDDPDHGAVQEKEHAMPKPDPKVELERDVERAIKDINREKTLESLIEFWRDLYQNNEQVSDDPRVVAAKDARKAELAPKPSADVGAGDIPY